MAGQRFVSVLACVLLGLASSTTAATVRRQVDALSADASMVNPLANCAAPPSQCIQCVASAPIPGNETYIKVTLDLSTCKTDGSAISWIGCCDGAGNAPGMCLGPQQPEDCSSLELPADVAYSKKCEDVTTATFTVHKDLETLRVMFHDGQFSGPITGNPPVETCGGTSPCGANIKEVSLTQCKINSNPDPECVTDSDCEDLPLKNCEVAKCNANKKCEAVPVTDVYTYKCAGTQYVCGPAEGEGLYVGKGKNWFLGSDPNAQCGIGTKDEWVHLDYPACLSPTYPGSCLAGDGLKCANQRGLSNFARGHCDAATGLWRCEYKYDIKGNEVGPICPASPNQPMF